ncbi:hypothetical protein ABZ905_36755 [Streptomyces parvus]|uniref:hypothetical protein n=1 Tax=Streptomyces parvus TaxID=66428 RepID=UPI0033EBA7C7
MTENNTPRRMTNKTKAMIVGGIALFGIGAMVNPSQGGGASDTVVPAPVPTTTAPIPTLSPSATEIQPLPEVTQVAPAAPLATDAGTMTVNAPQAPVMETVTVEPVPTITVTKTATETVTAEPKPNVTETVTAEPTETQRPTETAPEPTGTETFGSDPVFTKPGEDSQA